MLQKKPPLRNLILPDPGHVILDIDMSGADAQVVAWEAEDEDLKEAFRKGLKIHVHNFEAIYGIPYDKKEHKYKVAPGHIYPAYDEMKRAVHATNYYAQARTVASTLSWTVAAAENFQRRWFKLHPGIQEWHRRVDRQIQLTRTITNKFGNRIIFFGRPAEVLPEALAWTPQSTVGLLAARAGVTLRKEVRGWCRTLMQVHDSLVLQIPEDRYNAYHLNIIRDLVTVPVPYPDPLIIQWNVAASHKSWGEAIDINWDGEKV